MQKTKPCSFVILRISANKIILTFSKNLIEIFLWCENCNINGSYIISLLTVSKYVYLYYLS